LRVALAGAGRMATHHARAMARAGGPVQLVAVADPLAATQTEIQALWPNVQAFDSLEALLAAVPVDVVHVCTPPSTHVRLATTALEAGCHVYVEKPFAESRTAAAEVLRLAAERGLQVCAGHQYLFERPAARARELLPLLGQLVHVESFFAFAPSRRDPTGRTPLAPELQLLDVLPHPVYLLEHFLRLADPASEIEQTSLALGPNGTVHATFRCGKVTGSLVVTLEGRPVAHHVRLVGTRGMVHSDFVVGTVQRLLGPGTSGIDKAFAPYQLARQLVTEATRGLASRVIRRQRSYPGLAEIFGAFYEAIRSGAPSPVPPSSIVATQEICDQVAAVVTAHPTALQASPGRRERLQVAVTGGLGFLGSEVVRALQLRDAAVCVLTRRLPAPWERVPDVEYRLVDLGQPLAPTALRGCDVVLHCAAETRGGQGAHQRNSIDATRHLLTAAAATGVSQMLHVSSLAVVATPPSARDLVDETTPLTPDGARRGPYAWGKLESERLAVTLGRELGVAVKVVRPGPIVDYREFDPPGRLGRRVGPVFVAVGSPRDPVGVVDRAFAASTLAWLALHFSDAPTILHLVAPTVPTKRDLVDLLRRSNPDLSIVWLPRIVLVPLSWLAVVLQKVRRPRHEAMSLIPAFAPQYVDTSLIQAFEARVLGAPEHQARPAASLTLTV